jgi:hypothetical protein
MPANRNTTPTEIAGIVFDNPLFGNHIDEDFTKNCQR